jgi:hypothetical protein
LRISPIVSQGHQGAVRTNISLIDGTLACDQVGSGPNGRNPTTLALLQDPETSVRAAALMRSARAGRALADLIRQPQLGCN